MPYLPLGFAETFTGPCKPRAKPLPATLALEEGVVQPEGAVKVDVVKRKVIALWLHFFLNRIGSKHPEFLSDLLI